MAARSASVVVLICWGLLSQPAFGQAVFEKTPHWNALRKDNFFRHGEFRDLDERGYPVGWDDVAAFDRGDARIVNRSRGVIQLKCPERGGETSVSTTVELPDDTEFVTVLTRMRGPTVVPDKVEGAGAGMVYSLATDDGLERALPRVEPIYNYGSLGGWKTYRVTARLLPWETHLKICATIQDAAGEFEVDRVFVLSTQPGYQPTEEQAQSFETALRQDDAAAVTRLIKTAPELLEHRNGTMENGTPLIRATWYNAGNVVKELIRLGADLEASDTSWSNTPLAWCCWIGNGDVAEVLVNGGAKTGPRDYIRMAESTRKRNPSRSAHCDRIIQCIKAAQAVQPEE